MDAGNNAATDPQWQLHSVWLHICLHFYLLYYKSWRNLKYFWCRELHCIQYWRKKCLDPILTFSLAAYMPALFLLYYDNCQNLKHFGCRNWCCIQYWQQFVCIQHLHSVLLHICLHPLCCYMIIDCTENTLYTGNNAASNTCKLYSCIQYFEQSAIFFGWYTKCYRQKRKCDNTHFATKTA